MSGTSTSTPTPAWSKVISAGFAPVSTPIATSMPSRPCAAPGIDCLPQIRIFKAESFRLAALFALVFLTLTAVLIGTVLWIVAGAERETLIAANESDISTVMNGLHGEGLDEAIEVVQQRLGNPAAGAP